MSFILDALKKSESDRQRQSGPSLFEVKVAPPRRTIPVWAMAIAALLAINVVVISWMLLRHAAAQRTTAATASAGAAAPSTAPASTPAARTAAPPAAASSPPPAARTGQAPGRDVTSGAFASAPSSPPPAATAAGAAQAAAASPSAVTGPLAAGAPGAPASTRAQEPGAGTDTVSAGAPAAPNPGDYAPAVQPAAAQGSGASGGLPLYPQIVATDGLPTLHLDLHVYAKNPKDRFVMINMHKLVEGDSLPDGVHVDAIRPDGVVLSYHGTRFLLPRD